MTSNKIISVALGKTGQFGSVTYERKARTLRNCNAVITKTTRVINVRMGVQYDNIKDVKEKRSSGELPKENQGLNGAEWLHYPVIAQATKTGKLQLALNPTVNTKYETIWKVDGKQVDKSEIESFLQASEKRKSTGEKINVFRVCVDDIIDIK